LSLCVLVDVFEKVKEQFDERKLKLICQGGGRIQVDPAMRKINIYGSSLVSRSFCFV